MMAFVVVVHMLVCLLLIGLIMIQAGRGGGLVEGFSGVESMFGTKTNTFLTRTTTILSVLFFITCLRYPISLPVIKGSLKKILFFMLKIYPPGPGRWTPGS